MAMCATIAMPAHAAPAPAFGAPVPFAPGTTFDPMLDARLRWEDVDAATKPPTNADAVTLRARFGFEVFNKPSHIAFLAEAEGTLALDRDYNAFPGAFTAATLNNSHQRRPNFATIADPENLELNRLQFQYRTKPLTVTLGRQRINLDDQRFVGAAGWRQNEQTFDAVRVEGAYGPLFVDATYSNKVVTIYGNDAGPRRSFDGDFVFLGGGLRHGPVSAKAFAYLLDYGDPLALTSSSQTYGGRVTAVLPVTPKVKFNFAATYARQSAYKTQPTAYAADYVAAEGGLSAYGLTATAGYEELGGDSTAHKAFQTPLATLHKFNGWADLFLTTPQTLAYGGLKDVYGGLGYAFPKVKGIKGLNAQVVYHQFDSDYGSVNYGHEWDFSAGVKTGRVTWLAKYATFTARAAPFADTKKFWLQAEYSL
jgi:hypothetical protein